MTNVETIKDLIIRFGDPWNEHHRDDLGIEYAERIISMYDREGLTYYFQRCREWVSVQTIFIDLDGTVMVSCFSNITEESNEDWMDVQTNPEALARLGEVSENITIARMQLSRLKNESE